MQCVSSWALEPRIIPIRSVDGSNCLCACVALQNIKPPAARTIDVLTLPFRPLAIDLAGGSLSRRSMDVVGLPAVTLAREMKHSNSFMLEFGPEPHDKCWRCRLPPLSNTLSHQCSLGQGAAMHLLQPDSLWRRMWLSLRTFPGPIHAIVFQCNLPCVLSSKSKKHP